VKYNSFASESVTAGVGFGAGMIGSGEENTEDKGSLAAKRHKKPQEEDRE